MRYKQKPPTIQNLILNCREIELYILFLSFKRLCFLLKVISICAFRELLSFGNNIALHDVRDKSHQEHYIAFLALADSSPTIYLSRLER